MSAWFRFYVEALNDPKVQSLDGDTFKAWVNLLCVAAKNGGRLGSISEIAFHLRCDDNAAVTLIERLSNATLIDRVNGGANGYGYAPHGWEKRQYKSDSSKERMRRYRSRNGDVTVTPPEQIQNRTEEKGNSNEFPKKTVSLRSPAPPDVTEQAWADYLALRAKKKAPVTETVIAGLRREANKAGLSLQDVIETICTNGWQGFKADWVERKTPLESWHDRPANRMPSPAGG